jgi:hypothetical protein
LRRQYYRRLMLFTKPGPRYAKCIAAGIGLAVVVLLYGALSDPEGARGTRLLALLAAGLAGGTAGGAAFAFLGSVLSRRGMHVFARWIGACGFGFGTAAVLDWLLSGDTEALRWGVPMALMYGVGLASLEVVLRAGRS